MTGAPVVPVLGPLLVLLLRAAGDTEAARHEESWDRDWRFHRGLCSSSFRAAAAGAGAAAVTAPGSSGNITSDVCVSPGLDDSSWRWLALPHDWSREDLPARDVDTEFPVLDARYGAWKIQAGDNASFAAPDFNDSAWAVAKGGADWRQYGAAFEAVNATGWYRQHIVAIPSFFSDSTQDIILSLGVIAGADSTYLNGQLLGQTPPRSCGHHGCTAGGNTLGTRLYITPRAYHIPASLLHPPGQPNILAVRVVSYGGAGHGPANVTNMTDKSSFPPFGTTFPGGLYDDPNLKAGAATNRVGPFDAAVSPGTMGTGYTIGGTGYYRKTFRLPTTMGAAQRVFLRFDGVYMNSSVFLNGHMLGNRPYGYTTFEYELTPYLHAGNNTIAVKVENLGRNSRYYSGSGIYRHTWLTIVDAVYIPLWGVSVASSQLDIKSFHEASSATVVVNATLVNTAATTAQTLVVVDILRADGSTVGKTQLNASIFAGATTTISAKIVLGGTVELWSTDTPVMHRANVTVWSSTGDVDTSVVPFGVRQISFNSSHGFVLNNVATKMYGGCVHHDNGPLGAMAIDRAEDRRVELLKSHGYNAVRTSHNPPSQQFLDACDKHGLLVMNEAFDCWAEGKNPQDYHIFFNKWWRSDLTDFVRRDRNHPSVVMWSIGNEIPMRFTRQGANLSATMVELVHALDPGSGRAVTSAYPLIHEQDSAFLHNLDVAGYNYAGSGIYETDHQRLPNRTFVGTESFAQASFTMWNQVWNMTSVIGDFIWTAIDYLGDDYVGSEDGDADYLSGHHPWPWHISFCGDFDIVGHAKPQSVYRRVLWGVEPMGMLVHGPTKHPEIPVPWAPNGFNWDWPMELDSWTWPGADDFPLGVRVFARGCESVQLRLNDTAIDKAPVLANLTATFIVPYKKGKLEALCVNGSTIVPGISAALYTAGDPAALVLTVDRSTIQHDVKDLAYVTVMVVDANGVRVPVSVPVIFNVSGVGRLVAVGSGDPSDPTSFTGTHRSTWRGRALAVVQPLAGEDAGTVTVTATTPIGTIKSATISVATI